MDVFELDSVPYPEALELQRRLAAERALGLRPDTLLLLEHPSVITLGRGYRGHTVKNSPYAVLTTDRGGDATYHGPGQLIGYPIVHLKELGLLIGDYLRILEESLIATVGAFNIQARRVPGFTGIWVGEKKLASIGVAVRSWVAYHGFALNVSTDLEQFNGIYPCGLEPERMTSMERLLGRAPDPKSVRLQVRRELQARLCPNTAMVRPTAAS